MNDVVLWTSKVKYVDIATGEELTKQNVKQNYIILKKTKNVKIERQYNRVNSCEENIGVIEITNECTRTGKQLDLF